METESVNRCLAILMGTPQGEPELDDRVPGLEPFKSADTENIRKMLQQIDRPYPQGDGIDIAYQGSPADSMLVLLEGGLEIIQDGRMVRIQKTAAVIGYTFLLWEGLPKENAGGRAGLRTATIRVHQEALVLAIPAPVVWELIGRDEGFRKAIIVAQAEEVVRMYRREGQHLNNLADFFLAPYARLVPGPFRAEDCTMALFIMAGSKHRVRDSLPEELEPVLGLKDLWLLAITEFKNVRVESGDAAARTYAYRETAVFIPARKPCGAFVLFCPEMYPDSYLAIALGRELFGFPKRFGQTDYVRGDTLKCTQEVNVLVGARHLLRASWTEAEESNPSHLYESVSERCFIPKAFMRLVAPQVAAVHTLMNEVGLIDVPIQALQAIPDVPPRKHRVHRIQEVVFRTSSFRNVKRLVEAEVAITDSEFFLDGRCAAAFRLDLDMSFGASTIWANRLDQRSWFTKAVDSLRASAPSRFPRRRC